MERPDPELAVAEKTTLSQFLDYHRATLLWKIEGLSQEQLAQKTAASDLTLGGIVKHLALVEDTWFSERFLGKDSAEPWRDVDWDVDRDWEFHSAVDDDPAYLVELYQVACDESRGIVAEASLDDLSVATSRSRPGAHFSLRWIMLHMIEETARHNGHADFLREAIDGEVGQ